MDRKSFLLGVVTGILVCLAVPRLMNVRLTQATAVPDTLTNLAILLGSQLSQAPERLADYYSEGRRPYLTSEEIEFLGRLWRENVGGNDIRAYLCLQHGEPGDPNMKSVFFWVIEPGLVGNRYWQVQDIYVLDADELESHRLADLLKAPK